MLVSSIAMQHSHVMLVLDADAGYITMPGTSATEWTFQLSSDDGSYLYIDGAVLIANGGKPLRIPSHVHDLHCGVLSKPRPVS